MRAGAAELSTTIGVAYERADENFARALEIAGDAEWLWGPEASLDTYADQSKVAHQLTGEISAFGSEYRGSDYHLCANPIAKELVPDFSSFVLAGTRHYAEQARDGSLPREQRMIHLDHAKQYGLTLFHAAQYPAREELVSDEAFEATLRLGDAARHLTRAFYRGILGQETDAIEAELNQAAAILEADGIADFVAGIPLKHFKSQELDQPLTILAASLLSVEDHPETELLYALPAGGTQHGMATQLLYELKYPGRQAPELHYLPISTHSAKTDTLNGRVSPTVEKIVKQSDPTGKHVLICEDNSNTGTTLSLATDMLEASFPASCHVSMVELDPRRLEVKNRHPAPVTTITNYLHPDFTTAVGIVPITTGHYPDLQLRKIAPLRRARQQQEVGFRHESFPSSEYGDLPEAFLEEFNGVYKGVLRRCGDLYGYRNPYQVAASIVRHYAEQGLLGDVDIDEKYRLTQEMAYAAIHYPFLPDDIKPKLAAGQETLDYDPAAPWIRKGAVDFMGELAAYAHEADSRVIVWTKGDSAYYSSPPYIGMEEQRTRFDLSGLHTRLDEVGFFTGVGEFVAHPKKTALLGTNVLPKLRKFSPHVTDLVIADDSEKNLAEAAQQARRFGLTPHPINPLVHGTNRARLPELTLMAAQRAWGPTTAFIIDMDDTLLHEGFRKYHQPRNMALYLHNALQNLN